MLNTAGLQLAHDGAERVVEELTRHGGPWAAPLTDTGHEIVDPSSGMLRKQVQVGDDREMHAEWLATRFDESRYIAAIGLAPTPAGEFLVTVQVGHCVRAGDTVSLSGPLAFQPD